MHCWLDNGDQALTGADMDVAWAPEIGKPKNGFDVTPHTNDITEARRWHTQLAEGGREIMPFSATFWPPGDGALVDCFGVRWMVDGEHDSIGQRGVSGMPALQTGSRGAFNAASSRDLTSSQLQTHQSCTFDHEERSC